MLEADGQWLPRYYRGNQFHPRGNPTTGHSIPAVLPQVSPAKPQDSRSYRGITAIPITVQGSIVVVKKKYLLARNKCICTIVGTRSNLE